MQMSRSSKAWESTEGGGRWSLLLIITAETTALMFHPFPSCDSPCS